MTQNLFACILNRLKVSVSHTQLPIHTRNKPFPPLARLSPKSFGCRPISSLRFCWNSLSIVIAAKPFPTEPVILDTTPAAPPDGTGQKAKVTLTVDNTWEATSSQLFPFIWSFASVNLHRVTTKHCPQQDCILRSVSNAKDNYYFRTHVAYWMESCFSLVTVR